MSETTSTSFLSSVLGWLRSGYPDNVPPKDYFPLLALLKKSLTEDEAKAVIAQLAESHVVPVNPVDIEAAIAKVSDEPPSDDDVRQVAARLAAAGWPLTGFHGSNN
ncbi:DUF3349 domain-containing protein [Antrihabitans cavernicola]|uniref:DUF3349 domain-containing protein n=1 Tax=Antrihabitans cavernicola TaxID=2495913 RepID=A0A5A7SEV7_9NOCA|nr:DUF3349 domain-containing protein [Spelaeibacter cavernicola]KAA0024114.1 DUF3349 domain-containing protein [Spelaeibacter cavernicola]